MRSTISGLWEKKEATPIERGTGERWGGCRLNCGADRMKISGREKIRLTRSR